MTEPIQTTRMRRLPTVFGVDTSPYDTQIRVRTRIGQKSHLFLLVVPYPAGARRRVIEEV
jgi:hypothetical protein